MNFGNLKEVVNQFDIPDNIEIRIEYTGSDIELENGDTFKVKDYYIEDITNERKIIYLEVN